MLCGVAWHGCGPLRGLTCRVFGRSARYGWVSCRWRRLFASRLCFHGVTGCHSSLERYPIEDWEWGSESNAILERESRKTNCEYSAWRPGWRGWQCWCRADREPPSDPFHALAPDSNESGLSHRTMRSCSAATATSFLRRQGFRENSRRSGPCTTSVGGSNYPRKRPRSVFGG